MKFTSLLTSTTIAALVTATSVSLPVFTPMAFQASAQTAQEKIAQISAVKGKPESAVLMRKLYAKDLTPLGVQPGGAGMVVSLYSKKDDTTLALCTTFDVVVAIKKGKIAKFAPAEVK